MYIIHRKTQAIMHETKGIYKSKIIEENNVIYSKYSPIEILYENCEDYGASLQGRFDIAKKILGSKTKLPLPVFPFSGLYFFPTTSMKNDECIWISYYHIQDLGKVKNQVYIRLRDKTILQVKTSLNQLDRQRKRTSQVIAHFHYLILQTFNRF